MVYGAKLLTQDREDEIRMLRMTRTQEAHIWCRPAGVFGTTGYGYSTANTGAFKYIHAGHDQDYSRQRVCCEPKIA